MSKNNRDRQSIRLPNYNYAANGYYFVTICTHEKYCYFGNIINGKMQLSPTGKIADKFWLEIPQHSKHIYLDEYIVMPNHIHGIIIIDRPNGRDVPWNVPTDNVFRNNHAINNDCDIPQMMSELSPKSGSLSVTIRSYKSSVTRWCRQNGDKKLCWQPRFYEHIIRDRNSLNNIRRYIANNPVKWTEDINYNSKTLQ